MPAASATTIVALRLVRITALVLGSLLFLYACEFDDGSGSTIWWVELGVATGLGIASLGAGWFQITLAHRMGQHEFLIASDGRSVRARIVTSGNLVFHGHDLGGPHPEYEWTWTFRPTSFPAIRAALGGSDGDLLDLLEDTIPELDPHCRHDPGAWLRERGIPARYREKGVDSTHPTRELPITNLPQPISSQHKHSPPAHRNKSSTSQREKSPTSHHSRSSPSRRDYPPPPQPTRTDRDRRPSSHREQPPPTHRHQPPPPSHRDQSPQPRREQPQPSYHDQPAPSRSRMNVPRGTEQSGVALPRSARRPR
ncbi:hypothetical protein ACFQZZ_24030 [Nocardia sp. GCM10030253]|uniref:hypothetical protein n=1 Tax=Nocardia sp. GCM10030253 TaxID=3273404 RepID=UPI003624D565